MQFLKIHTLVVLTVCLLLVCDAANRQSSSCTWYHRADGIYCAHACLPNKIGICPVSIVQLFGRLKRGACNMIKYPQYDTPFDVQAGPCGVLTFTTFKILPYRKLRQLHTQLVSLQKFAAFNAISKCPVKTNAKHN